MPCTTAKLEANRQNARKSTGPRTPEGKARSSRNALKHGFCASASSLTPLEDRDAYDAYTASIIASFNPATAMEEDLANRIADLSWRLRRIPDAESALLTRDTLDDLMFKCARDGHEESNENQDQPNQEQRQEPLPDQDQDDEDTPPVPESPARLLAAAMAIPHNSYLTLQRYEQSLDRARSRALRELRQLQKDRRDNAAVDAEDAPRPNEPTTSSEISNLKSEIQPSPADHGPRIESRNEPTESSRPLRAVAPSRLPQPPLRNEPTARSESSNLKSKIPPLTTDNGPRTELQIKPNPQSEIRNSQSPDDPPRLHILKRSDLRPLPTPPDRRITDPPR